MIAKTITTAMHWIPQPTYLKQHPTETADAIQKRLKRGIWLDGVHAHTPAGSEHRWINTKAIQDWASGKPDPQTHGTKPAPKKSR